jgi:hypothetical protein
VTAATTRRPESAVTGVVPALRLAVRTVGPDLGFRLSLRMVEEYWVPISRAQYDR